MATHKLTGSFTLFDAPSPPPSSSDSESSHTESDIDEELEKDRARLKEQIVLAVQRQVAAERIAAAAAAVVVLQSPAHDLDIHLQNFISATEQTQNWVASTDLEVRASIHVQSIVGQPMQLGLFLSEHASPIKPGSHVCFYASHFKDVNRVAQSNRDTHSRLVPNTGRTLLYDGSRVASLYQRPTFDGNIKSMRGLPATAFLPSSAAARKMLSLWARGSMINSNFSSAGAVNHNVVCESFPTNLGIGDVVYYQAIRDILPGAELLQGSYNNADQRKRFQNV